jgi:hypothetical protein
MIVLSKEVLEQELKLSVGILEKWRNRLAEGIPGPEIPAPEDMAELWVQEFYAEMYLVANKLESIANITANHG